MRLHRSEDVRPAPFPADVRELAKTVRSECLRDDVATLSVPRHFFAEHDQNLRIGNLIAERFTSLGYRVTRIGQFHNVLALPPRPTGRPLQLIGAHYDSVPGTPGADDNASALAAMLECARVLSERALDVAFAAFNREEDGLLGSHEVAFGWPHEWPPLGSVQILEMVGFCSHTPGSQRVPPGLPIALPDRGDFLGLLGNGRPHTS